MRPGAAAETLPCMHDHPDSTDASFPPLLALADVQRLLLKSHPGVALCLDLGGRLRWLNAAGANRLGYEPQGLLGREVVGTLIDAGALAQHASALSAEFGETVPDDAMVLGARLRRGASSDEHEWVLRHEDGSACPTRLSMALLRDAEGGVVGLLAVEPVEAQAGSGDASMRLARHDPLTGLPTRAVLADRAEMAIQHAARQHRMVALMLIEIADFDDLCDEHGRSVGEDLLRATASRLHFELRKTDTATRFDGGQFVAMLVDLHHAEEARAVAAKIERALSAKVNVGVAIIALQVRIGLAWYPSHADQLLPLLEAAQAALSSLAEGQCGVVCAPLVPEVSDA